MWYHTDDALGKWLISLLWTSVISFSPLPVMTRQVQGCSACVYTAVQLYLEVPQFVLQCLKPIQLQLCLIKERVQWGNCSCWICLSKDEQAKICDCTTLICVLCVISHLTLTTGFPYPHRYWSHWCQQEYKVQIQHQRKEHFFTLLCEENANSRRRQ